MVAVTTAPIPDQKTGTSGLRKKTSVFRSPNYLQNWVQSLFNALGEELRGKELVLGGDGRFFNAEASQIIIKMAAANGVKKIFIGQNGMLSTPAVSVVIRGRHLFGGIIMTASHNPGGEHNDWGIKYNSSNGGPAPESLTDKIFVETKKIAEYHIAEFPDVDLATKGSHKIGDFEVEVIDSCEEYVQLMKKCFNFDAIKALFGKGFSFTYDAMHAVTGIYAQRIFVQELGVPAANIHNAVPKADFGGGHPDPNLTYAHELVERMKGGDFHLGAASDGDGDRNMILGSHGFFVTPSDSVAVIAANAAHIPYFAGGLKGLARSMPTSKALDSVAKKMSIPFFEVPTGWKFFGNLMDAGQLSICGEESFGTGGDHIREKDGIWSVLAWLQICAAHNASAASSANLVPVSAIVKQFWSSFGRNFFVRYDYEECDADSANKMFAHLDEVIKNPPSSIQHADQFEYKDPIDGSVTSRQGVRFLFASGDRIIFRISGTGSSGATIRLYVEHPETDTSKFELQATEACAPLLSVALEISQLEKFTGRTHPTVIT